jgi:hypothetical protein
LTRPTQQQQQQQQIAWQARRPKTSSLVFAATFSPWEKCQAFFQMGLAVKKKKKN